MQYFIAQQLAAYGSIICMLGWICNTGLMSWFLITDCRKDFSLVYFKFFYECSKNPDAAEIFWGYIFTLTIITLTIGLCIYGIGLRALQKSLK